MLGLFSGGLLGGTNARLTLGELLPRGLGTAKKPQKKKEGFSGDRNWVGGDCLTSKVWAKASIFQKAPLQQTAARALRWPAATGS